MDENLEIVVNGTSYGSIGDVPERLRALVVRELAAGRLQAIRERGKSKVRINISRKDFSARFGDVPATSARPTGGPARETAHGPVLGAGDPGGFGKLLFTLFAAGLAVAAYLRMFGRP